jgi:2-haloacid dehalogenase
MGTVRSVIVFDVSETLSDMAAPGDRFVQAGVPSSFAKLWFATLLRDGFAQAAAGYKGVFADIGAHILRGLLVEAGLGDGVDAAIEHVLAGMAELRVHADVPAGVRALKGAGYGPVTLSNGAADVAESLLFRAGLRDEFGLLLSVEDAAAWKPARAAYDTAAAACGKSPEQMLLVAVHPWDIHGAAEAGLQTAWMNRSGSAYPDYFTAPDYTSAPWANSPTGSQQQDPSPPAGVLARVPVP